MIIYEVGVGKEYSVIQDAIDAIPVDLLTAYKIMVYDGVYGGFEVINKVTSSLNSILIEPNYGSNVQINGNVNIVSQNVFLKKINIVGQVIFSLGGSYSKIIGCKIHDNYNTAYLVEIEAGVRDVFVELCALYNGNNGILISGALDNRIQNNILRNINNYAISTGEGIVNSYIINNTIVKSGTGIRYRGEQIVRIRNNNITHNTNGIVLDLPFTPDLSIKSRNNVWNNSVNYIKTSGGIDVRSFDPKYVNFSGNDFRLLANSPCIDNGDFTDAPFIDFDGKERPKISGYDIGAFEYSTENVAPVIIINQISQRTDGSGKVDISYTGIDENYDRCNLNLLEYSLNGVFAGEQKKMTIVENDTANDNIKSLRFTFTGTEFNLVWDALSDLGTGLENVSVYIRMRASDGVYNSNIASSICSVDTKKPTINSFIIDRDTEIEEDVSITGIVNLTLDVNGNLSSMKFSNDGVRWSSYEPFSNKKLNWNLISGYGGQAYQGIKRVYVKVKDMFGNETDGELFDFTWYKLTEKSVENARTGIKYHSIKAAVENIEDGDLLSISTNDTFYENFQINKNNFSLIVNDGFVPSINMGSKNAISIISANGILIKGLTLYGANRESFRVEDCENVVFEKNVFKGEYGISFINSSNLKIEGNIFKDGKKAIELNNCSGTLVQNNNFARESEIVIEMVNSPSLIINNNFVDNGTCLYNEFPNEDQSKVKNNIFYGNKLVINANPLWIIENNDFWNNKEEFEGLVPRVNKNIFKDPLFIDHKNDNFHLSYGSPCINTGCKEDAPEFDFDGIVRKQDIGFDIGAYEYNPVPEFLYNSVNLLQRDDVKDLFVYDLNKDILVTDWKSDYTKSWQLQNGDFPLLTYIVLTDSGIDIIDVKNNSLWMRFSRDVNNSFNGVEYLSVFASDGKIYASNEQGLICIDLTTDKIFIINEMGKYEYQGKISERNNGKGYVIVDSNIKIINSIVMSISAIRIDNKDIVVVGTGSGISVLKDLGAVNHYSNGKIVQKVILTDEGNLYYIADNRVNVLYDIHLKIDQINPDYYYSSNVPKPFTAPKILSGMINDIFVIPRESEYRHNVEKSTLIYVATNQGITAIHTNEITPKKSEKWGYSKHYGLKGSSTEFKVFDGESSDFRHIKAFDDMFIFVVRENDGDIFYVYDRRNFSIRMLRKETLPSRKVGVLGFHED